MITEAVPFTRKDSSSVAGYKASDENCLALEFEGGWWGA